jgi:small subunit ribosomal protein S13
MNVQYKFITGADLKKRTYDKIQKMKNIKSYKGVRHSYNMPVNGQRTHTNAKTRG